MPAYWVRRPVSAARPYQVMIRMSLVVYSAPTGSICQYAGSAASIPVYLMQCQYTGYTSSVLDILSV